MKTLLADRRRLAAYLAAALPVALAVVGELTRTPDPVPALAALLIALPLSIAGLGLVLPVWYLCRALPVESTPWPRLLATHGAAAAVASGTWSYLGAGLARVVGSYQPELPLADLYQAHIPAILAGGAILYLLSVSFHYALLAVDATRRAEQNALELAVLAREAELKALKAQVHPHFLFNSLNSISALVTSDPMRAREMCILLAEYFRKSLALGEKVSVSLAEELLVARTYLAIERHRFGARLRVEEVVDESARGCWLPPLLLQPLVENAVRHGIATLEDGGVLCIEARKDGDKLRVRVENPFDPDAPSRPGVGLGLQNVRRRLLARYGNEASFDSGRIGERFRVVLVMPAEMS